MTGAADEGAVDTAFWTGVAAAVERGDADEVEMDVMLRFLELSAPSAAEALTAVRRIDPARLAEMPVLALTLGLSLLLGQDRQRAAMEHFRIAAAGGRAKSHSAVPLQAFAGAEVEAVASRFLGRIPEARAAAAKALRADAALDFGTRMSLGAAYPLAIGQCGVSAMYGDDLATARGCFELALEYAHRGDAPTRVNTALGQLAWLDATEGRYREAEALIARIDEGAWRGEGWRDGVPAGSARLAEAMIAANAGDFDRAIEILGRSYWGDPVDEHWGFAAVLRAMVIAVSGAPMEAERGLRAELAAHPGETGAAIAAASGCDWMLELFATVRGDATVRAGDRSGLAGVPSLLALRAARAVPGPEGAELLARAARAATSPGQRAFVDIGGIIAAVNAPEGPARAAGFAVDLATLVAAHSVRWSLAFLGPAEREAALAAIQDPALAGTLRTAFARMPSLEWRPSVAVELTPREREVLRGLVDGRSREEIAERLFVSVNTVKTQLRSLYAKLGVSGREAALLRAVELGLIDR